MTSLTASRFRLIATAVLFSTAGAGIKATAMTSWQVASFRAGVAAITLFLVLRPTRADWTPRTLIVGIVYGAQMTLFVVSNKLTTAAESIFLQSTAPLYILLLGPWLLHEHVRRRDLLFMAALAVGMVMFFIGNRQPFASAPDPLSGNVIAAVSGVAWALTVIGLRWMGTREPAPGAVGATLVCGNLLTFLFGLPRAIPAADTTLSDWAIVGYLGVFQVSFSYLLLTRAVRDVPALEASLLLLLEPVLNPLWAWLVHGEQPGPWSLLGGAIIIVATGVKTIADARRS